MRTIEEMPYNSKKQKHQPATQSQCLIVTN